MLLMLNEKEEALQKALSCGDTDLGTGIRLVDFRIDVHVLALYVLMRIKSSEPPADYILRLQRLRSLPLKLHLQVRDLSIGHRR